MNTAATWLTAYIDETGNNTLEIEKEGASNLFICVAVVVNEEQNKLVEQRMREISRDEFSGSEIKSSGIGKKHKRRLKILNKVKDLSFGYYALVINKSDIKRDSGLQYKPVFYKHLNQMLYNRLLKGGTNLHIIADTIGGQAFMDSFGPYLKRKGKPDLFSTWDHKFADSKQTPQIQLADLVAGTLAWCFDKEKKCNCRDEFRNLLKPKEIDIGSWPLIYRDSAPAEAIGFGGKWDDHIYSCSVNRALKFIDEFDSHDKEDRQMQVAVLRHLIFIQQYENSDSSISLVSDALINHLRHLGFPKLSRQQLSSRVIGPLRDWGILISGGSDGYCLACNTADIYRYLDHDKNIIEPMLIRLNIARKGILQDTSNQYDVLESDEFGCLRLLAEAMSDYKVKEALNLVNGSGHFKGDFDENS